MVNVFTEDHAALTGARDVIFSEDILPEKSRNININWNQKLYSKYGTIFDLDLSVFNTVFSNRILPDYDANPNQIIYGNLDGESVTQGVTLNINSVSANGLKINMGATFIDSKIIRNNETIYPFLTEKISGNYRISYAIYNPKIIFDLSGTVIGTHETPATGFAGYKGPLQPRHKHNELSSYLHTFNEIDLFAGIKNYFRFQTCC